MQTIIETVNKQTLPSFNFTNGHVANNKFYIQEPSQAVTMFANPNGDITLQVSDLHAKFGSESMLYKKWFLTANGSLEVDISQLSFDIRLALKTQTLANGNVVPALEVVRSNLNIPTDHLKLEIQGNMIFRIVDDIQYVFNNEIRWAINQAVGYGVKSELPKIFDAMMVKGNGKTILYEGIGLDWQLPKAPYVTPKSVGFGIKGQFFKDNETFVADPPALPSYDTNSGSKAQLFMSTFLLNTLSQAVFETFKLNFTVTNSMIPKNIPLKLDTQTLDNFFPGLLKAYGEKPVDLEFDLKRIGTFDARARDEHFSVSVDSGVKFLVDGTENAIDVELMDVRLNFSLSFDNMRVNANVSEISIGYILEDKTQVKPINCMQIA